MAALKECMPWGVICSTKPHKNLQKGESQNATCHTGLRGVPHRIARSYRMETHDTITQSYFVGISFSKALRKVQNLATEGIRQRSSGVWGLRSVGPKLTRSIFG